MVMGVGTRSDGRWLSALQGRLINFEKRRKVSSHRPHFGGWKPDAPWLPPSCYLHGESWIQQGEPLPEEGAGGEQE